jgi:putative transposase
VAWAVTANIASVDEESLRNDIENLMRKTVEETPDAPLDE